MTLDYPYWHSPLILCWNWLWQQLLIKFHYAVVSDKIVTNLPPLLCITWAYCFLHFLTHACTRAHIHTDLVHLSCTSNAPTAGEDLYPFVNAFLTTPEREQGWADRQIGRHKQIDRQTDWQTERDRHMILLVLLLATVFSSTLIYSLFCICVHVLVLWLRIAPAGHDSAYFLNQYSSICTGEAPRLLWSLFYNQEWIKIDQQRCHGNASPLPPNVHMVSDPDLSVDYASCLDEVHRLIHRECACYILWTIKLCVLVYSLPLLYVQAKSVFQLMYPEEEFFPQPAPQPELKEEEVPPQEQQVGEEGEELAHEGHKDEVDEGEGGDNAARAAEETVSAAEAFNWDMFWMWLTMDLYSSCWWFSVTVIIICMHGVVLCIAPVWKCFIHLKTH